MDTGPQRRAASATDPATSPLPVDSEVQGGCQPAAETPNGDPSLPDRLALLAVLAVLAGVVLAVDFTWIVKAGSTAANALGATLVAIGGSLLMVASTDKLDWSKRNWRPNTLAIGGLLVGLGGVVVAISAWQLFIEETGPAGP